MSRVHKALIEGLAALSLRGSCCFCGTCCCCCCCCVLFQVIVEMLLMCADLQLVILGLQLLQGAAALGVLCLRGWAV